MNLGVVFINAFLAITFSSFFVVSVLAVCLRIFKRMKFRILVPLVILGGIGLAGIGNYFLHPLLFTSWHISQNQSVPTNGCVSYEPEFSSLYATYTMSKQEFQLWVANHEPTLELDNEPPLVHDEKRLQMNSPELSYATEDTDGGKRLCVYYAEGLMYLVYHSL